MNSDFVLELFRGFVFVGSAYCFCSIGEKLTQGFWVEGVSGLWFAVFFGSRLSLLLSSSSFFFPLSSLGAGSGFLSLVRVCLFAGQRPREDGRCSFCMHVRSSFCSALSPRVGPPLPCPFFLFLLSLSFFLLHARHLTQTHPPVLLAVHDRLVRPSPGPLL